MKTENDDEKEFKVKSYGKSELASLYLPDITPGSATTLLMKWIQKSPDLAEALANKGLQPLDRRFTPAQVQLIVNAIGEP